MKTGTILATLIFLLTTTALAQSTRRYIELDQTNLADNSYALLGRPEVRTDLAMTSNQVASFRKMLDTKPDGRPSLANLLDAQQQQRLRQLMLQMKGPVMVALDPELQKQLSLTPEQRKSLTQSIEHYEYFRIPFVRRYGRQLVAGITDQTIEERKAELDALALEITQIVKERDQDILRILTEEQRQKFLELEGQVLTISWPEHDLVFGEAFVE